MQRYIFDFTKNHSRVPEHLHHLVLPHTMNSYLYRYYVKNPVGIKQIFVRDKRVLSFLNADITHEKYVDIECFETDDNVMLESFHHFIEYIRNKHPNIRYAIDENRNIHTIKY